MATQKRRNFKMHRKLLLDTIQRQAGTLEKANVEAGMNSIEAGADKFCITLDDNVNSTGKAVITFLDSGKGFRNEEEIEMFFETFGQPHKENENVIDEISKKKEKQERLNIIERGLRQVAEAQAAANVVKEKAVVEAQQKAEVAEQTKTEALTKASMAKEVADIEKAQAQIKLDTAELDAKAIEVLATAERKKIELAGALTELEQAMIDAQVKMADDVSKNLAQIPVPAIIMGGGNTKTGGSQLENLINLKLMTDSGIMKKLGIDEKLVERSIDRTIKDVEKITE
jgi:hypothetical protein